MPSLTPTRTPIRVLVAAGLAVLGSLATTGCYSPGGPGMSIDQFTYQSTAHQPWTITVVDTRTGDAIWSEEVPVGQKLVMRFYRDQGELGAFGPDLMRYRIMETDRNGIPLTEKLSVPPASARRIDSALRPSPEFPSDLYEPTPFETPPVSPADQPLPPVPAWLGEPADDAPAGDGLLTSDDGPTPWDRPGATSPIDEMLEQLGETAPAEDNEDN